VFWAKDASVHFDWRVRVLPRWQERMSATDQLLGVFWEGELPAREQLYVLGDRLRMLDMLAARVQERFQPSEAELRLKRARDRVRHAGASAKLPVRRAAERVLARARPTSPRG
jgi:hypothetical protein